MTFCWRFKNLPGLFKVARSGLLESGFRCCQDGHLAVWPRTHAHVARAARATRRPGTGSHPDPDCKSSVESSLPRVPGSPLLRAWIAIWKISSHQCWCNSGKTLSSSRGVPGRNGKRGNEYGAYCAECSDKALAGHRERGASRHAIGRTGVEEWSSKPASRANEGVGMTAADSDTDQPPTDKDGYYVGKKKKKGVVPEKMDGRDQN
ncbi:hypothetical protein F5144DRAFT_149658 [Chaetomium tenue]|uniref:Uncharacterized protein n=1 Tax=Chaetomium tenue TaxID=1854479 RepID=A0ACB7PJ65_9PEZI|nr:hypothetical protein F5144DRAFT_149658 [Chaetomium globosum]